MQRINLCTLFLCAMLVACSTPTPTPTPVPPTATFVPPTATPVPTTIPPPTATRLSLVASPVPTATTAHPPTQASVPALPAEPRAIKFKAADGQDLAGLYYPAASNPAPIVVLMHWAGSDQVDWAEVAFWLQNRGLGKRTPNPRNFTWRDPSWFPAMRIAIAPEPVKLAFWAPELQRVQSFAVFTFTYRGCDANGCRQLDKKGWLEDSYAAMKTASELEGVDGKRMITAGASIGADGAAHGCAWLNAQKGKGMCLGAMPFSPGNYLANPYPAATMPLQNEQPSKPVWCLYAERDRESAPTCKSASGSTYRLISFGDTTLHGMEMIAPKVQPNALQLLLDFLKLAFGS